jgi:cell division protein FtsW
MSATTRRATATSIAPARPATRRAASQKTGRRALSETLRTGTAALDYPLIAVLATLLVLGLSMVYSASIMSAQSQGLAAPYYFFRQIGWIAAGLVLMGVMTLIPYWVWQKLAIPVLVVALALLVLVLVKGDYLFGARRTLFHGSVQPSEFVKLAVVIYVAAWVASKRDQLGQVQGGLIPFAILMGLVAGLIVLEHSFSVTIIILVIGVTMFFVGGGNVKQLLVTGLVGATVLGLLVWKSDYGATRVQNWWQTLFDPSLAQYNVAQAMAIIRRGGGIDTNQTNFLLKGNVPLLWSDYLFANVGADLGFIGTFTVVALFAILGYRGLGIALNAPDRFAGLTAIGITTWMLTQAVIHMSASLALIPTTGVPLPFMSYGGSSLIASMAAMGLLLSISRYSPIKRAPYADFSFGWWHRGPRLTNSGRSQRAASARRRTTARLGANNTRHAPVEQPTTRTQRPAVRNPRGAVRRPAAPKR